MRMRVVKLIKPKTFIAERDLAQIAWTHLPSSQSSGTVVFNERVAWANIASVSRPLTLWMDRSARLNPRRGANRPFACDKRGRRSPIPTITAQLAPEKMRCSSLFYSSNALWSAWALFELEILSCHRCALSVVCNCGNGHDPIQAVGSWSLQSRNQGKGLCYVTWQKNLVLLIGRPTP